MRLASIAGGEAEVLRKAPGDLLRYAAMGGVIVSTALVAALSAALALHMALRMSWPWAVIIGLGWGALILNLDRLLVVQMVRHAKKWHSLAIAAPRVVLAIILGAVISTPMVLQVFQPEIKSELDVMHAQAISNYDNMLAGSKQFALIPVLEKRIPQEQATVDAGVDPNVAAVPAVIAAQTTYNKAEAVYEKAEQAVVCEKEGTCGSHKVGAGIAYKEKVAIRDDAERKRNDAYAALQSARQEALHNQQVSQTTAVNAAKANLQSDQKQLAGLQAGLQADEQAHTGIATGDNGLLARLEALDQLSSDRPTLKTAHWALFALFLAIELLPVLMKLLQVLGPETDYERMLAIRSEEALKEASRTSKSRLRIKRKIERDRAKKAITAGVAGNQILIDTQTEVMTSVLEAWRQYAITRSQEDLLRWQQSRPVASATTPPDPVPPPTADAGQGLPEEPVPGPGPVDHDSGPAGQDQGVGHYLNGLAHDPVPPVPPRLALPAPRPGAADTADPGSYPPEAVGQAVADQAGNGQAGNGQAGNGQAGNGQAGNGQAGNGRGPASRTGRHAAPESAPEPPEPPPPAEPEEYRGSGQEAVTAETVLLDPDWDGQGRRRTQP